MHQLGSTLLNLLCMNICFQEDEEGRGDVPRLSEGEDSITEQTHHIIIPSYTSWFNYNRYLDTHTRAHIQLPPVHNVTACLALPPLPAFTP